MSFHYKNCLISLTFFAIFTPFSGENKQEIVRVAFCLNDTLLEEDGMNFYRRGRGKTNFAPIINFLDTFWMFQQKNQRFTSTIRFNHSKIVLFYHIISQLNTTKWKL